MVKRLICLLKLGFGFVVLRYLPMAELNANKAEQVSCSTTNSCINREVKFHDSLKVPTSRR